MCGCQRSHPLWPARAHAHRLHGHHDRHCVGRPIEQLRVHDGRDILLNAIQGLCYRHYPSVVGAGTAELAVGVK